MPDNNLDEQIPAPELSENQKYVNEKVLCGIFGL